MPRPPITLLATVLSLGAACGARSVVTPTQGESDLELITLEYGEGTAVTVAIVRPEVYSETGSHPVILALPWGGGTTDLALGMIDAYWDAEASARGYIVVSPAIRGTTLETEADLFLPVLFAWMDANLSFDANRVAIVGASNGGRGIFHALVSDPSRFSALIGMPGSFTGSVDNLVPFAGKPAWLMVGENDTGWRTATDNTKVALDAAGVPTTVDVLPGQGHVLSVSQSTLMDWMDQALAGSD